MNCSLFTDCKEISGLLNQLQTFWQLPLVELIGVLKGLGLLELWHLIYPRFSTECGMLVFLTNSHFIKFQVGYLAVLCLFLVIDSFGWFWIGSLCKSILYFFYYILDYAKCKQASDLWQQLELASELESDLWNTVCGLGQEVSCWFQYWKNSTCYV